MTFSNTQLHGGEIDGFAETYGIPREQWIDLSTGINPVPFPIPDLAADYWHRLPDSGLDGWLREAAANYYGVDDPANVVPTPGSQAAIQWLPRLISPTRVAIIGPTYHEHAVCWSRAGHTVSEVLGVEAIPDTADVLVCVNPNNPDGRRFEPEALLALAGGRLLVIDEAFADLTPEISLAGAVGADNVVVLRSFGKFFGLAGLRLGFVLTGEPLASRIREALGPWAVSGPAAAIGAVALADVAWARGARVRLTAAAGRLDGLLMRNGLPVAGGTGLFRLTATDRAEELFEHLAQAAILVRRFTERPSWLRFGLPSDDASFDRLARVLGDWRPKAAGPTSQPAAAPGRAAETRRSAEAYVCRRSVYSSFSG
ncbi:MAG: threonine-phosphate decarboxylase CobD [Rhodospirillales bacterium]